MASKVTVKKPMTLLSEQTITSPCLKIGGELWWLESLNVRCGIIRKVLEANNEVEVITENGVITLNADRHLLMA